MFFEFKITTPAKKYEATPQTTIIQLKPGIIHQADAIFPGGCAALLHVQIFYQLVQIWPSNPDASFATDNEKITWGEGFPLDQPPYQLMVRTWNDDDFYPHTVLLRFAMIAEEIPPPPELPIVGQFQLSDLEGLL